MTEDEGGGKPIRNDEEREPAGTAGDSAKEAGKRPGDAAGESDGEGHAAIDVDLAHDRAS